MSRACYIIGLPESGKTTFLAAMGGILEMTTDRELSLVSCTDKVYLDAIALKWSQCRPMEHTSMEDVQETRLTVREKSGEEYELILPDRDGEYFRLERRNEAFTEDFHRSLKECENILLFMNPSAVKHEPMLGEVMIPENEESDESAEGGEEREKDASLKNEKSKSAKKFSIGEQAEHIGLIQSILSSAVRPLKIKIIISAWDVYLETEEIKTPLDAIKRDLPMAWQMLMSHRDELDVAYWGISAQGGDWTQDEVRQRIMEMNVEDRVKVVDENGDNIEDMMKIFL